MVRILGSIIEIENDFIVYPIKYYNSKYNADSGSQSPCDSFKSYIDIRSFILKGAFPDKLNYIIDSVIISDKYRTVDEFAWNFDNEFQTRNIIFNIIFFDRDFITFSFLIDTYGCGAAHNMYSIDYINYDISSNRILRLSDLIPRQMFEKLETICKGKFKTKYKKSDQEIDDFKLPQSYAILRKGILFQFQPYEMGPFSEGAMTIFLPYSEVSVLLNQSETVSKLLR